MNQPFSPFEASDYPPSSGISEVDSLSDSDWLDISSGRDSDDNESVSSQASDREGHSSVPPSRRSSISLGSSRDGDVEAWEGFVEDSADEAQPATTTDLLYSVAVAADGSDLVVAPILDIDGDPVEDQRVRDALDQSLMGTLSASRSSTGGNPSTAHGSLRDLRLSFPDPLSGSRDELQRSYDNVQSSDVQISVAEEVQMPLAAKAPLNEDPGLTTTPEVLDDEVFPYEGGFIAELDVLLYGAASPIKWTFAQELMQIAATASGRKLRSISQSLDGTTHWVHTERQINKYASLIDTVGIRDRTERGIIQSEALTLFEPSQRPSLAIVYLPFPISILPAHTYYLPVLAPTSAELADDSRHKAAQRDWRSLLIPPSKVLRLKGSLGSPLIESLDDIEAPYTRRIWQSTDDAQVKRQRSMKTITEQLTSVNAVTLFAVVSLIMGFAVNISLRSRTLTPTPTSNDQPDGALRFYAPAINHTRVDRTSPIIDATHDVAPSSLKDFALSVFNPPSPPSVVFSRMPLKSGASTSAITVVEDIPTALKGPTCDNCQVSPMAAKEVSLRPVPTTDVAEIPLKSPAPTTPPIAVMKPSTSAMTTSLGFKLVDSLQEVVDVKVKALVEVVNGVNQDTKELVGAIDDLLGAVCRQSKTFVEQSLDTAQLIREHLSYRNEKAKGKAKEIRAKLTSGGGELRENLKARTDVAKQRARALSEKLVTTESWYWKVHSGWTQKLDEKLTGARGRIRNGRLLGRGGRGGREGGRCTTLRTCRFS